MKRMQEALQETRRITLHENLEVALPAAVLIRIVYEATAQARWIPATGAGQREETPERVLGSVLTYCYAAGIYGSADIESAAIHDPAVRYLCANHRPDWHTIRNFRRRNMAALKAAVGTMLLLLARRLGRIDLARPEHRSEADRRLGRAMQADSYALDI